MLHDPLKNKPSNEGVQWFTNVNLVEGGAEGGRHRWEGEGGGQRWKGAEEEAKEKGEGGGGGEEHRVHRAGGTDEHKEKEGWLFDTLIEELIDLLIN